MESVPVCVRLILKVSDKDKTPRFNFAGQVKQIVARKYY